MQSSSFSLWEQFFMLSEAAESFLKSVVDLSLHIIKKEKNL